MIPAFCLSSISPSTFNANWESTLTKIGSWDDLDDGDTASCSKEIINIIIKVLSISSHKYFPESMCKALQLPCFKLKSVRLSSRPSFPCSCCK